MPDFTFRVETTLGGRQAGVAELDRQGTREQLVPTQGQPPLCHLALAQHFMHHDLARFDGGPATMPFLQGISY